MSANLEPPVVRDPGAIADHASMQAFLNCYLRETGAGVVKDADTVPVETDAARVVRVSLDQQGLTLYAPFAYESETGRHCFAGFFYEGATDVLPLDAHTLVALCVKELSLSRDGDPGELAHRATLSRRAIERFVRERDDDVTSPAATFSEAEQSLLFGHLMHPTPKSRQGMGDNPAFAPELRGSFQLHYARVAPELVEDFSALSHSASEWVKADLAATGHESLVDTDDVFVPLHPRQAAHLKRQPAVEETVTDGAIEFLGPLGREFYPTTSVRTLYAPDAPFMVKTSLPVRITNSLRTNTREELPRGVAVADLLDTEVGDDLRQTFPDFDVIRDPASLTVTLGEGESGFETVLRANPFPGDPERVTPLVALCQDAPTGATDSRLGRLIREIAEREGRSTDAVSQEWFCEYLIRSVRPALWLYLEQGLGVEAHQQNSVLALDDAGYPDTFYYRDNQGYYLPESKQAAVESVLPNAADRLGTCCPDEVADERLRYYLILNNAFGLVNAFGCAGLCDERDLLSILREELEHCRAFDHDDSSLLTDLLEAPTLPCKANLLTRFHDMDELVGSLENQSVYTDIDNPLVEQ